MDFLKKKVYYDENIWKANNSKSFRSFSVIDSEDSSLINAFDAAL
jgi:hypothetical protein